MSRVPEDMLDDEELHPFADFVAGAISFATVIAVIALLVWSLW